VIILTSRPIIYNKQCKIKKALMDSKNKTVIRIQVNPGVARNEVTGIYGGLFKLGIAAPPVKGRANKELISYLSNLLRIKRDDIEIISGQKTRIKTIAVSGLDKEVIIDKLLARDALKRGFQSEISW
jgi:uncharacterized protein (TIGR00251 family)